MDINICRVCLSNVVHKDIKSLSIKGKNVSYVEVLQFCLGIELHNVSKGSKLCFKCFEKIQEFYKFKELALQNNSYFNNNTDFTKELKVVAVKLENYTKNVFTHEDEPEIFINGNEFDDSCSEIFCNNVENSENHFKLSLQSDIIKKEDIKVEEDNEHYEDDIFLSVMREVKYEYVRNEPSETEATNPLTKMTVKKKKYKTVSKEQVCPECGKAVKDIKTHLEKHLPADQRKKKKCRHCDKVFSTYGARIKHEKVKHFGKKFKCEQCGKAVVNLRAHILTVHERSSLKYKCLLCDKRFLTKAYLNVHIVTHHTKERTFRCGQCDKAFVQKVTLEQHRRQVHEKEKSFMCQFCSNSFFKKSHLMNHIRSHTKEKPYICKDCGRGFGSSTVLKQHMTTHTGIKKYQCTFCDMAFARLNYLRRHTLSHTKEKNYACRYCGVKFLRSDHRSRHEYTAHKKAMPGQCIEDIDPKEK